MTEAAGAWRRGDLHIAGVLAESAMACFAAAGNHGGELLANGLLAVCHGSVSDGDAAEIAARALALDVDTVGIQVVALLAASGMARVAGWEARWRALPDDARRLDVLSVNEARSILQERWDSPPQGSEGLDDLGGDPASELGIDR